MKAFHELVHIIARLRHPEKGCPWDIKQTPQSLMPYLLEETYELMEAVQNENDDQIKEELGDLLLHILFQARLAEESRRFSLEDVVERINRKLIERHPHVFESDQAISAEEVLKNWEKIKKKKSSRGVLGGVPTKLPALLKAQRVQEKAAGVGFDWPELAPVMDKVREEWQEFEDAMQSQNSEHIEEELGDMLFTLVNLARRLHLSAELVLTKSTDKFIRRFNQVESMAQGKLSGMSLEEMDDLWEKSKKKCK